MAGFEDSYVGQLRKLVGDHKLIVPAARAIIQNRQGHILLIRRSDNGRWALPAGSIELDESIYDCLKREVKEETGLDVISATPIAIYSEPGFSFVSAYGQAYQMFAVVFRVDEWGGTLLTETDETVNASFFPLDDLPDIPAHHRETLADLQQCDGRFILK